MSVRFSCAVCCVIFCVPACNTVLGYVAGYDLMLDRLTLALMELVILGGWDKTEKIAMAYQAFCIS